MPVRTAPKRKEPEPDPWKRATRIRISMIARERGLSDAEIEPAMNCGTSAVVAFAAKYDVSLDWLVCGDRKGLLQKVCAP